MNDLKQLKLALQTARQEQPRLFNRVKNRRRMRTLGFISILTGFIVVLFFEDTFIKKDSRIIIWLLLSFIGVILLALGLFRMISSKRALKENTAHIEQLEREIIQAEHV